MRADIVPGGIFPDYELAAHYPQILREVTRDIRPDWDLAASGLRGNWDAGDHLMHHPYQQADRMRTVTPRPVRKG